MRSEGARLLGAVDMTQRQIAARIGVRQPTIAGWVSGKHVPGPRHRAAMLAAFQIPLESWPSEDPEVTRLREEVERVRADRDRLIAEARRVIADVARSSPGTLRALLRVLSSEADI